jgi:hypothetical protein
MSGEVVLLGQVACALEQRNRLPQPALEERDVAAHREHPGREQRDAQSLGRGEDDVAEGHREVVLAGERGRVDERRLEPQDVGVVGHVLELGQAGLRQLGRALAVAGRVEDLGLKRDRLRQRRAIAGRLP